MINASGNDQTDSQTLLNQIVIEFMQEQKRKRRWRWVSRTLWLAFFIIIAYFLFSSDTDKITGSKPHVGLVDLSGEIGDSTNANAENFAKGLDAAYKNSGMKALIIRINSPGGSPVQGNYMYNLLQYYRKTYPAIKTYAVCVDLCASAGYMVAVGTDEIYANESSMVGSIGVLYNGFGFVDALQKIGVSRRLQTAGANKGFLDPFSPVTAEQQQLLQVMLDEIHQQFIAKVKEGRGSRLKIDDQTFSGLFWTGTQAKERGLIDGLASSGQLAREIVKIDQVTDYTYKQNVLDRVSKNIGASMASQLPSALGIHQGLR